MARAKNRGYQQKLSLLYDPSAGGWVNTSGSPKSLKKSKDYKDDSNSVKNQRDLLNDFLPNAH